MLLPLSVWKTLELVDACPSDDRQPGKVVFCQKEMIALIVAAALAGAIGPEAIHDWANARVNRKQILRKFGWPRIPDATTLRRRLIALRQDEMEKWMQSVMAKLISMSDAAKQAKKARRERTKVALPFDAVSFDGKSARRCKGADGRPIHMLGAFNVLDKRPLAQIEIGEKENEITRSLDLLSSLRLAPGTVVMADAMHCQRKTAQAICGGGWHYIQIAKGNQGALQDSLIPMFAPDPGMSQQEKDEVKWTRQAAKTTEKRHGRIETRELTVTTDLPSKDCWPHAKQCFEMKRTRQAKGKTQTETIHGITDLSADEADAPQLLEALRSHWGIESWHWMLDMNFGEDDLGIRDKAGAANMCRFIRLACAIQIHAHAMGASGTRSVRGERYSCGTFNGSLAYLGRSVRKEPSTESRLAG